MISIKENCSNEIIVNKSKFITEFIKISDCDDAKSILMTIKTKYLNATHYCYAYICGNQKKCSDDGEPSKTAGAPILNVLESNKLDNVLCVVIRYFGGVKLGAGGLVRAYTKAVTLGLEKTSLVNLIEGKELKIIFSYTNIKQLDHLLKNVSIINKDFDNDVTYNILINNRSLDEIYNELLLITFNIIEIKKILIEE